MKPLRDRWEQRRTSGGKRILEQFAGGTDREPWLMRPKAGAGSAPSRSHDLAGSAQMATADMLHRRSELGAGASRKTARFNSSASPSFDSLGSFSTANCLDRSATTLDRR